MAVVQLAFDVSSEPLYRWENFYISDSNAQAIILIRQWPQWPTRTLFLNGPAYSGKTHIAHLWRQESRAPFISLTSFSKEEIAAQVRANPFLILEDLVPPFDEEALFHLYNLVQEEQGYLLITGMSHPSTWQIALPDLASRLRAITVVDLKEPDDDLLPALLVKRFSDRQLRVPQRVIDYLVTHMERSYEAVETICHSLDRESLAQKRALTLPLAREVLILK